MGAGRKTSTYDVDSRASTASFDEARRNLGEEGQLAGVVFGCTHETMDECLRNLIFGLPKSHWNYVYYIEPGLPIFLFNYNDRNMHGIFRATSYGQLEINPHAWTGTEHLKTRYPAQVEVEVWKKCRPVHEREFKHILSQCYYSNGERDNYFVFELTKNEAKGLISKFESVTASAGPTPQRLPGPQQSVPAAARPASTASSASVVSAPSPDGWQTIVKKGGAKPPLPTAAAPSGNAWAKPLDMNGSPSAKEASAAPVATPQPPAQQPAVSAAAAAPPKPATSPPPAQPASSTPNTQAAAIAQPTRAASPASAASVSTAIGSVVSDTAKSSYKPVDSPGPNASSTSSGIPAAGANAEHGGSLSNGQADAPVSQASTIARLRARQAALKQRRAAGLSGPAALETSMQLLQLENEELRLGQTVLANEIMALRRDLATLGQRSQLSFAPAPSVVGLLTEGGGSFAAESVPIARPAAARPQVPTTQELYLMGGNDSKDWLDTVDIFTPRTGKWRKGAAMPEARGYGAASVLPGRILFMGGGNGSTWKKTVLSYDLNSNAWDYAAEMSTVRGSLASAVLEGKVYAIGGGQPGICLETAEIYDPELDTFMSGKSMVNKRFTTSAAVLGGSIWVCGGYDGTRYLSTVERFDPREGRWMDAPSMAQKRGAHTCTVTNGHLVAIGGWDGVNFLSTVEMLDPAAGKWVPTTPLAEPRAYCSAATVNGRMVVAGGMAGSTPATTMQRFDWPNRTWTSLTLPETVLGKRSFLAACVVDQQS